MRTTIWIGFLMAMVAGAGSAQEAAEPDPIEAYEEHEIRGWRVLVNRRLSWDAPQEFRATMELLDHQLYQVERVVPSIALESLRGVTIWVERDEPNHPCMAYHPSGEWLKAHGMNPLKARGVEVANAGRFLQWTRAQPWMVLHELAHAYHDRVLRFEDRPIREAFERARETGRYERVDHIDGRDGVRHYALTNEKEYFAELSESYFGTNDFYPFVRAELRKVDPDGLAVVERAWMRGVEPRPNEAE